MFFVRGSAHSLHCLLLHTVQLKSLAVMAMNEPERHGQHPRPALLTHQHRPASGRLSQNPPGRVRRPHPAQWRRRQGGRGGRVVGACASACPAPLLSPWTKSVSRQTLSTRGLPNGVATLCTWGAEGSDRRISSIQFYKCAGPRRWLYFNLTRAPTPRCMAQSQRALRTRHQLTSQCRDTRRAVAARDSRLRAPLGWCLPVVSPARRAAR